VRPRVRPALKAVAAGLAAVAGTATMAAMPAQAATPAQPAASGGGCNTEIKDGFRIGACISRQDNWWYPDAYVTQSPVGCYWVSIDMRDSHLNLWERKQFDTCTTGHLVGDSTFI
jgi:hypothetical protein